MDLSEQLIGEEEGRSRTVYRDTSARHLATIGIGCLVDPSVLGCGLCDEAISAQFQHDAAGAYAIAQKFPAFSTCNPVRQAALVSMTFQMGTKPQSWPNFMQALTDEDYDAAAAAGLDTDWARTQTPKRASREMAMLKSGIWVPKEDT